MRTDTDTGTAEVTDTRDPALDLEVRGAATGGVLVAYTLVVATPTEAVDSVRFTLDGRPLRTDDTPPYLVGIDPVTLSTGPHQVAATATIDGANAEATANLYVDRTAPTLRFVEPGTSSSGARDGVLFVDLGASDDSGIAVVEILGPDGEIVDTLTDAPYAADLDVSDLEPGVYDVHARAADFAGTWSTVSARFLVCPDDAPLACGGSCREPEFVDDSPDHCGECGRACSRRTEICEAGACVCGPGTSECGGRCVDLRVDDDHCGSCERECNADQACLDGNCAAAPADGFAYIPAGTFTMGGSDVGAAGAELPAHMVTISSPFMLSTHEVTQREWLQHAPRSPAAFTRCGPECAVESVTWWEALLYANARSRDEGLAPCYLLGGCSTRPLGTGTLCTSVFVDAPRQNPLACEGYRLPTEAEWEYAYRAGTTTSTYNGNIDNLDCSVLDNLAAIAWFECNADGPQPVRRLLPNRFGLYDMAGNVFEWTYDSWTLFTDEPATDPFVGDNGSQLRVVKGGSWSERAARHRAAARVSEPPDILSAGTGFRLARSIGGR